MSKLHRQFRVTYMTPDHREKHVTVTASNQQSAMNKVSIAKGVVVSRAHLIKE